MSAQPTRPDARTTLLNEAIKICEQVQSDWSTHSVAPLAVGACIERLAALRDAETPTRESAHDLRERMESAVACIDAEKEDRERRLLRAAAENDEVSRMAFRCQIQAFDQAIRFVNDALAAAPAPSARPEMPSILHHSHDWTLSAYAPGFGDVSNCRRCHVLSFQMAAGELCAAPSAREAERRETMIQNMVKHGLDVRVLSEAYAFTCDDESGEVYGLTAGDQNWEPTGIKTEPLTAAPPVSGAPTPGLDAIAAMRAKLYQQRDALEQSNPYEGESASGYNVGRCEIINDWLTWLTKLEAPAPSVERVTGPTQETK